MLLAALHGDAARFVANDRLFVRREGSDLRARGMPTIVKVMGESLRMFRGPVPARAGARAGRLPLVGRSRGTTETG